MLEKKARTLLSEYRVSDPSAIEEEVAAHESAFSNDKIVLYRSLCNKRE